MKGDFSRGHTPDRKRGEKYRRVLLQEGRLLLDSDIAASVDAYDRLLRDLAGDVGCKLGSPDLGYIVTPGPLFAFFETLDDVSGLPALGDAFRAFRDHAIKYLERYPALYLDCTAAAGTVTVQGRMTLTTADFPTLRIWAQIPTGAQLLLKIDGNLAGISPGLGTGSFDVYDIDVAGLGITSYSTLELGFAASGASNEAWIGLIEGVQAAGVEPTFWFTAGRFYLDGLEVEHGPADGTYPETTFPAAAGFDAFSSELTGATYLVAYLEGWERQITTVEDAGILEQALGGTLDTTLRTEAIGQVKWATVVNTGGAEFEITGEIACGVFDNIDRGAATLTVTTTPSASDPDPCAIPADGGYTGGENRFYRFEVHVGGNIGAAVLKWSKNNGADLSTVLSVDDATTGLATVSGSVTLEDGDLVELLYEATDLGDQDLGVADVGTGIFTPAQRRVGTLYYIETTSKTSQVQLLDLTSKAPADISAFVDGMGDPKPGLKVRRWSGLCDTTGAVSGFDLGDGITITLGGTGFRPGDYWQYEARRNKDNANGTWQASPHGPERLFAPLALLEYSTSTTPLLLHHWCEHQFSALCDLEADDIAYDGAKSGTTADTVQEAIDELYTLVDEGGCCTAFLEPSKSLVDDAARVQAVVDDLPTGGTICLKAGVYTFQSSVKILGKTVTIQGCPEAVIVCNGEGADGFVVIGPTDTKSPAGELTLVDLVVHATAIAGSIVHVTYPLGGLSYSALTVKSSALVHTGKGKYGIRIGDGDPSTVDPLAPDPWTTKGIKVKLPLPSLSLEETTIVAPWPVVIDYVWGAHIDRCVLVGETGGVSATVLGRGDMRGSTISMTLNDTVRASVTGIPSDSLPVAINAIVETALDYNTIAQPTAGTGLLLQNSVLFDSEGNVIIAYVAVRFGTVSLFNSTNDVFLGIALGARMDELDQSRIEGTYLIAYEGIALHLPWNVNDSTVEQCRVQGAAGIVLGADSALAALPTDKYGYSDFRDLRISSNRIDVAGYSGGLASDTAISFSAGILFGAAQPADNGPPPVVYGSWARIMVDHNTVDGNNTNVGIAALLVEQSLLNSGNDGNFNFSFEGPLSFRIEDNTVTHARAGVVVHGGGFEVRRNTITGNVEPAETGSPVPRTGILLWEALAPIVENNLVHFDLVGYSGTFEATTGISLSSGTLYIGNSYGRLIGNVVRSNTGIVPLSVDAATGEASYYDLLLQDNDFQGATSQLIGVYYPCLSGNHFRGGLSADACGYGVLRGNSIRWGYDTPSLKLTRLFGSWQIEDNYIESDLWVFPDTDLVIINPGFTAEKFWDHYLVEKAPWLKELISFKTDEAKPQKKPPRDATLLDVTPTPEVPASAPAGPNPLAVARRMRVLSGREAPEASYAPAPLDNAPVKVAVKKGERKSVLELVLDKTRKKVAELLEDLQAAVPVLYANEYSMDVQVEGNWVAGNMLVGYVYPSTVATGGYDPTVYAKAYPSVYTSVLVSDNRVGAFLNVNRYTPDSVVCDNATYQYFGLGAAVPGPINVHNLDLG